MQTKVTATSPSSAPSFSSSSPEITYLRVRTTSVIPLCLLIGTSNCTMSWLFPHITHYALQLQWTQLRLQIPTQNSYAWAHPFQICHVHHNHQEVRHQYDIQTCSASGSQALAKNEIDTIFGGHSSTECIPIFCYVPWVPNPDGNSSACLSRYVLL